MLFYNLHNLLQTCLKKEEALPGKTTKWSKFVNENFVILVYFALALHRILASQETWLYWVKKEEEENL